MKDVVGKKRARKYYDQEAKNYINMYKTGYEEYPANLIRLNFTIKLLKQRTFKNILDVGCGSAGPMIRLLREGFLVKGCDFSNAMVKEAKKELTKAGFSDDLIFHADIEKKLPITDKFDAIIAYGVFPHLVNEKKALLNMKKLLNDKGELFIEFRNDLFSTFSLNKYSFDFFLNRLIDTKPLPQNIFKNIVKFYSEQLKIEKPKISKSRKILFTDILAKFHNPLTINNLFESNGLRIKNLHFYHYHALPPIFEKKYPAIFRKLSLALENTNDKKGYLMASAFVVEASKND